MRAFIAVLPPREVIDQLTSFLEPRRDALAPHGRWRWTRPEHLHLTLAFLPELDEWREETLVEDGAEWARRARPLSLQLAGAGAFPDPGTARVLWAAVQEGAATQEGAAMQEGAATQDLAEPRGAARGRADHRPGHGPAGRAGSADSLAGWARGLRAIASRAGARVDGTRFSPHVTLGRSVGRPGPAGHLVQALDTLETSAWVADEVHLIASFLGQGPGGTPRYEVRHSWQLGSSGS